jgi:hypothetical protein
MEVRRDYANKVQRRVVEIFKMYCRYRQDKRIMDHMLTKSV